jgi:hypothetical protein
LQQGVQVVNRVHCGTSLLAAAVCVCVVVRRAVVVGLVALVVPPAALADYAMTVRKTRVEPGERMTIWGNGCRGGTRFHLGMRVYLVAARHQAQYTIFKPRPPDGPPYHFLGRFWCTHTDAPQPWGDGGYWTGTVTFRVPRLVPGRYQLVLYCPPCHKGPGGNLVASNWYFDGKRRHWLHALVISRR